MQVFNSVCILSVGNAMESFTTFECEKDIYENQRYLGDA